MVIVDLDPIGIRDSNPVGNEGALRIVSASARSVLLPQTLRIPRCYVLANTSLP